MRGMGKNHRGDGSEPTVSGLVELNSNTYVLSGSSSSSRYGEYTNSSNGSTKVFGCPQWNGMGGGFYTKSVTKQNNQFYYIHSNDSSKNIYYDNGYWVVGKRNSSSWWSADSQPTPNSPINLTYHGRSGQNYTLSFIGYVAGNETTPAWVGDVAKWQ